MSQGLANVGDVLAGKYRVERILGIGGMGMVVSATHLDLDQHVAIKFMLPAAMESAEAKQRFMREARAAGRLTSEHVCRVSDVGQFETGQPYIVMEFLQGQDLGTLLKRKGPLPVSQAVDYILQASEGMAEAHAHGIVHRDLKPDNLFLAARVDGSYVIKVLDFGISKAHVTGIATKTGDIMGSPAYMAPEQMQSTRDVDERADIWSLGVILYQLISGRMPFVADTLPALCLAVIHDAPPSLVTVRQDLPPGLAEVVMRCLAKNKDQRFPTVLDLAKALSPFASEESVGAVTRIRSMLERRRPMTAPPLMMLPSEFSDVVAPTLMTTSGSLEVTAPPLATGSNPPRDLVTTVSSSAGESMSLIEQRKLPMGLIGAIAGGIGLVALIIVMVMMKKSATEDGDAKGNAIKPVATTPAQETPPPPPPKDETPPAPPPQTQPQTQQATGPSVEPIDEAPKSQENVTVVNDSGSATTPPTPPTQNTTKPAAGGGGAKGRGGTKPPKGGSGPKDTKDPKDNTKKGPDAAGSAAGPPPPPPPKDDGSDDDDRWLHMHHDGKK